VEQRLEQAGLGYCDLTRLNRWPKGPEQIGLSTIHSAKGLEFDHVLLPGLNQQVTPHGADSGDDALQQLRRLLAMAIGRARETVVLGYKPGEESSLVSLLDPSTYQLVEM
jgi:superfamily I DNA/RNA helicase